MVPEGQQIDPTKVRIGLAIVSIVVLVGLGIMITADAALAKAIGFAVAAVGVVRVYRLVSALKRERAASS